jgi:hypothetical protein
MLAYIHGKLAGQALQICPYFFVVLEANSMFWV